MNKIIRQILQDDNFAKIVQKIKLSNQHTIEMPDNFSARILTIAALAKYFPVVLVIKDSAEQNQFWSQLSTMGLNPINLEVGNENKNFSQILYQYYRESNRRILILPIGIVAKKFSSLSTFKKQIIQLTLGQKISPRILNKSLLNIKYTKQNKVILKGDFSQRGNIFDIFPENLNHPIRLEFEDDQIVQLFQYDLYSGQKIKQLTKTKIIPKSCSAKDGYLLDWLKSDDLVVFSEPEDCQAKLDEINILEEGLLNFEQIVSRLKTKIINLEVLPKDDKIVTDLNFKNSENFQGRLGQFAKRLSDLSSAGYQIFISTNYQKQLKRFLQNDKIFGIQFLKSELISGFYYPDGKIAAFSDLEIFGPQKNIISKRKKGEENFIKLLKLNDLIVHQDHGVGRFVKFDFLPAKLAKNFSQTHNLRYYYLEYSGSDKLYVPENQISKLSRYIGVAGQKVKLSKLGSAVWEKTLKIAKKHAQDLARELLSIYSQRKVRRGFSFQANEEWERMIKGSFEYPETPDQTKAIKEIYQDMEKPEPADRLIAGDVGFGKTEVIIRAALRALSSGKQVAVLAPTTVLAEQHLATFQKRLSQFPINIESLSRFKSKKQQSGIIKKIKTGQIDIIIGTHRLLSKDVDFFDLGLAIIDEEQRFGVKDKEKLKRFRVEVDILTVTATPIPRTLQMAITGIKKISQINTPPAGRKATEIKISRPDNCLIKKYILRELNRQGQIYYLSNRISAIQAKAKKLAGMLDPKIKIAQVHGQMPEVEIAKTMKDFTNGKFDILVCTTLIENGLDLPKVNTIIVEEADKFGLAELYQLKGRVGRGERQAYGLFLVPEKIKIDFTARKRLAAFLQAKELGSGLQIAQDDLEIRGGGNILGREQSGQMAAIGLTLYSQLLEQAIDRVKEGK